MTRTRQVFTKGTSTADIKVALDDVLASTPNVIGVSIKWNAGNCTLFVQYLDTEVRYHGECDTGDKRRVVEFSDQ